MPGKFVALRGPRDLASGRPWVDIKSSAGSFSHREFSPQYYVSILQSFNVQAVVRLNEPKYDAADFVKGGIAVADLPFDDCTPPPPDVVATFLTLAEALPGALAVHCKSGLGRTGTLIALYMMKHHGFTAREAMGWLRIVRPGSVIGPQQQYLCDKEAVMHRAGEEFRRAGPRCPTQILNGECGVEVVQRLIRETQCRVSGAMAKFSRKDADPAAASVTAGSGAAAARELGVRVAASSLRRASMRAAATAALRRSSCVT